MKSKLTPKQDKAAIKYVECGDKSEAYRYAYNTENMKQETIWTSANELFENPKVARRVEQLQEKHRVRHDVTVDTLTTELDEAKELAKKVKNPSAAVSAIVAKGKLHGLMVERKHVTGQRDTTDASRLTDDELTAIILKNQAKLNEKEKQKADSLH